jgi:hypothetical protein
MRLRIAVTVVLTVAAVVACAGCRPTAVSTPADGGLPAIVMKTVEEQDDALRYSIWARYPQLRGHLAPTVENKVNTAIADMAVREIPGFRKDAANEAAWAAMNGVQEQNCFLRVDFEIPYLSEDLVSVRMRFENYTGGAHGMSFTRVLNVRLGDGAILGAEGLFTDGKQGLQLLSQDCAVDLKRQYGADYEGMKSFVDRGTEPTADNFASVALEPGALVVSFDPYQVGPYAAGPREVRIPVDEVRSMLVVTLSPGAFSLVLEPRS